MCDWCWQSDEDEEDEDEDMAPVEGDNDSLPDASVKGDDEFETVLTCSRVFNCCRFKAWSSVCY
jgi:hypothetical protein